MKIELYTEKELKERREWKQEYNMFDILLGKKIKMQGRTAGYYMVNFDKKLFFVPRCLVKGVIG